MRHSRFTEDDICAWLRDADRGRPFDEICREADISMRTLYRWRAKMGGLDAKAIATLKRLEGENRRLRQLVTLSGAALNGEAPATPGKGASPPPVSRTASRLASAYRTCRAR